MTSAFWLMFGTAGESVGYGLSNYKGKLHEMNGAMERLLVRYAKKGITEMPETLEKFMERMRQRGRVTYDAYAGRHRESFSGGGNIQSFSG